MPAKLPACVHCNRGVRNPVYCPHCWLSWSYPCCSERCLQNHIQTAHPKEAAAQQAKKEAQKETGEAERENRRRTRRRLNNALDRLEKEKAEIESGMRAGCPHCGAELRVPRKYKGKTIHCPNCKAELNVPEAELISVPEPVIPFWRRKTVWQNAVAWGVILAFLGWAWLKHEPVSQADSLFKEGRTAEAIAKYEEIWDSGVGSRPLQRIVDYHLGLGNEAEAIRWIEKGLDRRPEYKYESPAAQALFERVKAKREAAK